MIMGNLLRVRTVTATVMATNSSHGTDPDAAEQVPGIAHPTVVPTNFDADADGDAEADDDE